MVIAIATTINLSYQLLGTGTENLAYITFFNFTMTLKVVYYFPCAAVTNYHNYGGLKQQKFFLSQF